MMLAKIPILTNVNENTRLRPRKRSHAVKGLIESTFSEPKKIA